MRTKYNVLFGVILLLFLITGNVRALDYNNNSKAAEYSNEAHEMAKKGNLTQALELYKKSNELYPKLEWGIYNEGMTYYDLGRFREALEDFKRDAENYPERVSTYFRIGEMYLKLGDRKLALESFEKTVKCIPKNSDEFYFRAKSFEELGMAKDAQRDYEKARSLNPAGALKLDEYYSIEYFNNAFDLQKRGNSVEALGLYKKSINLYPRFKSGYYNQGMALRDLGRYQEALEAFQNEANNYPEDLLSYYRIGEMYKKFGNKELSKANFKISANKKANSAQEYYFRARSLEELGLISQSLNDYEKARQMDPKFVDKQESNVSVFKKLDRWISLYIPENRTRYVTYALIVIALVILWKKWEKYKELKQQVIDEENIRYIQSHLGIYTFTEEDSEDQSKLYWYPNTVELLRTWDVHQLEFALERLLDDYSDAENYGGYLSDIYCLITTEIDYRKGVISEENGYYEGIS